MTRIICPVCGHEACHEARGLCGGCYRKAHRTGMVTAFALGRRAPRAHDRRDYWRAWKRASLAQHLEASHG